MSNLVEHAKCELSLINEEQEYVDSLIKIVQIFADMGHSGFSAMYCVETLNRLLRFENLSQLTNNPDEWMFIAEDVWGGEGGIWQSKRNPSAFSNDGGKHYYLLSEGGNDKHRTPLHESKEYQP